MTRVLLLLAIALLLAGCRLPGEPYRFAGDTQSQAHDVVAGAIANQCPPAVALHLTVTDVTETSYAGHDAWRFTLTSGERRIVGYAWWSRETNTDYSIILGCKR